VSAKTTRIVVKGEAWDVPRGFGRAYADVAYGEEHCEPETLNDILGLIGYCATTETIESWTLRQRVDALVYAANVSARASDNVVRRCPRPDWFPEHPWRGPEIGEAGTIFGGPGPTPIERTSPEVSADTSTSKGRTE